MIHGLDGSVYFVQGFWDYSLYLGFGPFISKVKTIKTKLGGLDSVKEGLF